MQMFLKLPGFTDNIFTHLLAGLGAGFFAVSIGSPVDVVCALDAGFTHYLVCSCTIFWLSDNTYSFVLFFNIVTCIQVKSRMMGDSTYRSTLDCFVKTLKNDV